jgi:hypothetical protein
MLRINVGSKSASEAAASQVVACVASHTAHDTATLWMKVPVNDNVVAALNSQRRRPSGTRGGLGIATADDDRT